MGLGRNIRNYVFVTGAPRAGTTFVGQVLSLPLSVDYLHEPFNRGALPGFRQRYQYIRPDCSSSATADYRQSVDRVFAYDFKMRKSTHVGSGLRGLAKFVLGDRGTFYLRQARINPFHIACIVKDPTASFLGAYLQKAYRVRPVTVVKHPVSFAASLRRLGWVPSFHWHGEQDDLLEDHAEHIEAAMQFDWEDPVTAAAAQWRLLYGVQLAQASEVQARGGTNAWHMVVVENLSENPVEGFRRLYTSLCLPWSKCVEYRIRRLTTGRSGEARPGRVQDLRRNSAMIFETRLQQLTADERRRIYEITAPVALELYDEESFAI